MAFPVLPPKYYLTHFFEFLDFLEEHYLFLMHEPHRRFIVDFRSLSEDAQCTFVRMLNRKGSIFDQEAFCKYSEIEDFKGAFAELEAHAFTRKLEENDKFLVIGHLNKNELRQWYARNQLISKPSMSRERLVNMGKQNYLTLNLQTLSDVEQKRIQLRTDEIEYLLFLYFGEIQRSLSLYTLRDLGIRKSNTLKHEFKARFKDMDEAQAEYFFARKLDRFDDLESTEQLNSLMAAALEFKNLPSSTRALKDELLLRIAESALPDDADLALIALSESHHPEARIKAAKQLYKMGQKEECRSLLEAVIEQPRSGVELLFAEDFLARKFEKKKIGYLTEMLRNAEHIELSDFYLKRPERGVRDFYRQQGYNAFFTENYLWTSLFGVLFWEELFESEEAAIHNPFERSPADLVSPDFYNHHRWALEKKLGVLKDLPLAEKTILQSLTKNYGRLNDIFQWHPSLANTLVSFLRNSTRQDVARVLRTMAQQFEFHHSGFPDLMVEKDGTLRFIEVKAEGDALRANQLAQMKLLKTAGFEVEILRVVWKTDPNQIYVVLDVETTGGSAGFHRVTEIGAVKMQNGKVIEEFQTLLNPDRPIPAFITQITGITDEMVAHAPRFHEIAPKLLDFLEGAIFVAHNVKFDYGFIQREFARAGIEFVRPQLCTCLGMRRAYPGLTSYSLKNLTDHFRISLRQHHRALSDARAASELLLLMNSKRAPELTLQEEPSTLFE